MALLFFASGGLYVFVWAFWARRWCSATLERADQPLWKSVALIVPIFNLFLLLDLGKLIDGVAWRAALPPRRVSLPFLAIASVIVYALWRLPNPWWLVSTLGFVPVAVLQWWLVRAARELAGDAAAPSSFTIVEWIVVVLGSLLWILAAVGASIPDEGKPMTWVPAGVIAVAAAALAAIARWTVPLPAPVVDATAVEPTG